jgi:hypothetical protein
MYIGVTTYPDFLKTQNVQTAIAGQTVFTGLNYDPGNVEIYRNGLRLLPSQYSAPNGSTLTIYTPSVLGDKIDVVSREENAVGSDVVSVNGKTGVVVIDHFDLPDMPWLDGSGRIPASLLPTSVVGAVVYQGTWNATSGSAPSASPTKGQYWVVSVQGTTSLSGINQWYVGDTAIYNGTAWDRLDGSANEVLSVNGHTGAVVLSAGDITSSLGFTPVQQGGGINQSTNKVYVGWSTEGLRVTVDSTDVGMFVIATSPEHPTGPGIINYGRDAHTLLLDNNQGMISVGTAHALYGAQYLRFRAEPSLWGGPYGEMIIGSSGENYISGNTNLAGGAFTITPPPGDNSTKVATTSFVTTALGGMSSSTFVMKDGDTMTDSLRILGGGTGATLSPTVWSPTVTSPAGWAGVSNAQGASNGTFATISQTGFYSTPSLITSNYGFVIPTNAIINLIHIQIVSSVSGNATDCFGHVTLRYGGGTIGVEQQFTEGSGAFINGSASTWGTPLTPAMINDPSFGLSLSYASQDFENAQANISVDAISIQVFYTEYGANSGTLYLGDSYDKFLQYNGTSYVLNNAPLYVDGALSVQGTGAFTNTVSVGGYSVLTTQAGPIIAPFTKALVNDTATRKSAPNASGTKYISTEAASLYPSVGVDGDIWYQY